jgi:hypothetical protein
MADSPCTPLVACEGLDGRVVLQRTVYGPSLFEDLGSLQFGDFTIPGGAVRPFVDFRFRVQWIPKELCRGPVSSIMSLAPTETVTAGIRTARRDSFSQLMSDAAESSVVATHSQRQFSRDATVPVAPAPAGGGGGGGGGGLLGALGLGDVNAGDLVQLAPIVIGLFGSFFSDIGSVAGGVIGGVLGGPAGAAAGAALGGAVGGAGDGAVGGGSGPGGRAPAGSPVVDTHERISELIDSVERRESQSHLRQTVVSHDTETEEFLTRTFYNPYRDRSLQLRFMPVYRHFDVVTTIWRAVPGFALLTAAADPQRERAPIAGALLSQFESPALAARAAGGASSGGPLISTAGANRAIMAWTHLGHDDDVVRRPLAELLVRHADPAERAAGTLVEQGLRWEQAEVRANAIHVPLAPVDVAAKAWNLEPKAASSLADKLALLEPDRLRLLLPEATTRSVHVFAGTHVEAVPGECTLPGVISDALSAPEDKD